MLFSGVVVQKRLEDGSWSKPKPMIPTGDGRTHRVADGPWEPYVKPQAPLSFLQRLRARFAKRGGK